MENLVKLGTTIGASGIFAFLSKDSIQRILGPTADYLGGELRDFTKRRIENIGRIFQNAESKLGDDIKNPGAVPPKVLKAILDEGSFSNDEVAIEYLGGILASSRTETGRDDRGARMAKIIDSLSTYQLRTHYLVYSTISNIFSGSEYSLSAESSRRKLQIFLPLLNYGKAMEFTDNELKQINSIFAHIFSGLHSDNLLHERWMYGQKEQVLNVYPDAPEGGGIVCQPTILGAEIFLWAFGHPDKSVDFIFNPNFIPVIDGMPRNVEGSHTTNK